MPSNIIIALTFAISIIDGKRKEQMTNSQNYVIIGHLVVTVWFLLDLGFQLYNKAYADFGEEIDAYNIKWMR